MATAGRAGKVSLEHDGDISIKRTGQVGGYHARLRVLDIVSLTPSNRSRREP